MERHGSDYLMRVYPLGKGISVHLGRDTAFAFSLSLLYIFIRIYKEMLICKLTPKPSPDMESAVTLTVHLCYYGKHSATPSLW